MTLPRGMKDVDDTELDGISYVRERFEEMAAAYDYEMLWPSPLELLSTLETKSGPAIRDEIYNFTDKGGREVGLRFDLTMGITRHVASDLSAPLPAKVSSFGGVFRYDEPQKNRYRHFNQWDVEIYGKPHISQDVELVEFTAKFFESLPLHTTIRISHRCIMESCIRDAFGDNPAAISDMLRAIDKLQKKSPDNIVEEFSGYDSDAVYRILDIAQNGESGLDTHTSYVYLTDMVDMLANVGVHNIQIDLCIVRGLDYYTGMVFEVFGDDKHVALAGGGRYDMLPAAFGRQMGAAGVAGGVERIVSALNYTKRDTRQVALLYTHHGMFPQAARLASSLRSAGVHIRMDISGRPLKKQMATYRDCPTVLIVAPNEMREGNVIVRDMLEGVERLVKYDDIPSVIQ